jgi:hypothetical protein
MTAHFIATALALFATTATADPILSIDITLAADEDYARFLTAARGHLATLRPTTDVPADVTRMITIAAAEPLWLLEAGYPSGGCGVQPGGQLAFVRALRAATQTDAVALVSFTYLTDLPDDVPDGYTAYYGIGTDCFRRYLGTLGLRAVDGTAKPALAAIAPAP